MNLIILSGNLAREIELSKDKNGNSYTFNCVAIKRDYKEADGTYKTDFINIMLYGRNADYLAKYAKKGDRVELCGWWKTETYKKDDGTYEHRNDCVVKDIKAYASKKEITADDLASEVNIEPKEEEDDTEDLPF